MVENSADIFNDRGRKSISDQRTIEEQKEEISRLKDVIAEMFHASLDKLRN